MQRSACKCRQTQMTVTWLSARERVDGRATPALKATLPLGRNPSCLQGWIYGSASRLTSLSVRQHQFPENCTWLWLKYQECDSVSGICCLHAALQLRFHGRWHQQHSSSPAYNILKAIQKLINSKCAPNFLTQLVSAFTFAHAGTKPSSFSSS